MRKNILKTKLNHISSGLGKTKLSKSSNLLNLPRLSNLPKLFSIFLLAVLSLPLLNTPLAHAASPGDVVINELMYNPGTGNQDDEFIELYNTTGSDIDLGGWSFSAGVTLNTVTFNPGTIIQSHGYLVVSPNAVQTMATYGVVSPGEYAPTNLSISY